MNGIEFLEKTATEQQEAFCVIAAKFVDGTPEEVHRHFTQGHYSSEWNTWEEQMIHLFDSADIPAAKESTIPVVKEGYIVAGFRSVCGIFHSLDEAFRELYFFQRKQGRSPDKFCIRKVSYQLLSDGRVIIGNVILDNLKIDADIRRKSPELCDLLRKQGEPIEDPNEPKKVRVQDDDEDEDWLNEEEDAPAAKKPTRVKLAPKPLF